MAKHPQQSADAGTARLAAYFLATLPAPESAAVEAALYADPALAATAFAVEDDLVNDYARGALSPAERRAFEQNYLVTDERRARLALARALLAELELPPTPVPARWWQRWFTPIRLGYAAGLLLCAALGWWWWSSRVHPPPPPVLVTQSSPAPLVTPLPAVSPAPAPASSPSPRPAPVLASLTLVSGGVRGNDGGKALPAVTLTPATTAVSLRLVVRDAAFPRYQAVLEDQTGRRVWRAARLTTNARAEGLPAIALQIPASRFGQGDYVVRLTAQGQVGGSLTVGEYSFRVAR